MKNYIGNSLQVRGAERYILQGEKGDGMHFLYVRNGKGLELWISMDRAGDVSRAIYKGENMGFFGPCGYVAPQYYDANGVGFLKSFTGGFFTTCGLTVVGSPCVDEGEELPLHGNVSHIPAKLNSIEEKENELVIKLTVTDTAIFGRKLIMDRTYTISYTENKFELRDTVTNLSASSSPYMILYHCNMGYPLLNEKSIVKIPNNGVIPREENAKKFVGTATVMEKPQDGFQERCYYYDVKKCGKTANVGIYSPDIQKGMVMSYDAESLPCFTEWKMMGKTDYVLGLEPGNCTPDGRDVLRKNGTLQFLLPDERKTNVVKFSFVADENDFEKFF